MEAAAISRASGKKPLVVGIGGTPRPASSSEGALRLCLEFATSDGAETQIFTAAELARMPAFLPGGERAKEVRELVEAVRRADGIVIASPGYHGAMSGLIKNALDYVEDLRDDTRPYLDGRAVGLVAVASGWQAAVTTLVTLRSVVHALRGWPTPLGVAINSDQARWDDAGRPAEATIRNQLATMTAQVLELAR